MHYIDNRQTVNVVASVPIVKHQSKTMYTMLCIMLNSYCSPNLALLKAQVSLQLGKVFSSDNGVSVSIMYSYMY